MKTKTSHTPNNPEGTINNLKLEKLARRVENIKLEVTDTINCLSGLGMDQAKAMLDDAEALLSDAMSELDDRSTD